MSSARLTQRKFQKEYLRFAKMEGWYGKAIPGYWRRRRDSMRAFLMETGAYDLDGKAILEVGAGAYSVTHGLKGKIRVYKIDLIVDEHVGLQHQGILADMHYLPFRDAVFHLVIYPASIHFSGDARKALSEAARALKCGGRIIIMDSPVYPSDHDGEKTLAERAGKLGDIHPAVLGRYLVREKIKRIAEELRLTAKKMESRTSLPRRLIRKAVEAYKGRKLAAFPLVVLEKR